MTALAQTESGRLLLTFLLSMVPVVELRGGIPLGLSLGLTPLQSFLCAALGNMLPVPFLILLTRRVFAWLHRSRRLSPYIRALERRGAEKADLVRKYRLPGLIILVAIPLPGTGAWTGALVAALLDIRLKTAIPAIALGVLIAGGLVLCASLGIIAVI
ncbi:MAG: small multi-drug export protein [Oscillospiraceae bacterium]|nr:small multi-drug export protein [Oscillospiraceae bacterium]